MDNLIKCDRCNSDACYVQEVNETLKNYMCYGCGFITNTLMEDGSKFLKDQMELLPNLYKELMGEDNHGKVWMPSTVNVLDKGMVFANGKSAYDWKWGAVLAVEVKDDEKEKFPIKGKKDEYYKWRMDMKTLKEFEENDYMEVLEYIQIFKN